MFTIHSQLSLIARYTDTDSSLSSAPGEVCTNSVGFRSSRIFHQLFLQALDQVVMSNESDADSRSRMFTLNARARINLICRSCQLLKLIDCF